MILPGWQGHRSRRESLSRRGTRAARVANEGMAKWNLWDREDLRHFLPKDVGDGLTIKLVLVQAASQLVVGVSCMDRPRDPVWPQAFSGIFGPPQWPTTLGTRNATARNESCYLPGTSAI